MTPEQFAQDEIARLVAENERLTAQADRHRVLIASLLARADAAEAEVARLLDLLSSTVDELESQERMTAKAEAEVARLSEVVRDVMMTARNARISEGVALRRIADVTAHALLVQEVDRG